MLKQTQHPSLFCRSCWQPAEWFESHQDCIPLWGRAPAVDILSLSMDMMHVKWLGVDSYYIGSVLSYLIDMKLPGSPQENLTRLWSEIKAGYAAHKSATRFSCMSLSMFRAGKSPFPQLKGKAAEVKNLIPVLADILSNYLVDNDFERLMHTGLMQSLAIDQCLAETKGYARHWEVGLIPPVSSPKRHSPNLTPSNTWFLEFIIGTPKVLLQSFHLAPTLTKTPTISRETSLEPTNPWRLTGHTLLLFQQACNQYNKVIVDLGQQAHQAARLFNFTVKNHCMEHVALDAEEINPSLVWTFASEGFLGKVRQMVQCAAPGSAPGVVHRKVMFNYSRALIGTLKPEWRWVWEKEHLLLLLPPMVKTTLVHKRGWYWNIRDEQENMHTRTRRGKQR